MQANYNKQRTPTTFDLPSADVDFLAALQKFIERDAKRRSRIVRDSLSIRIDGVHQRVIDSESWCLLEFGGGTSKVEIVGRDAEGEVVIATYLPTYDGPKTEAWKVSLPWGDELSCTFEYDDDECIHVEAKRIVKPKLGEEPAQLTRVPQQGFFRFDRADVERLRNGDPATEQHFTVYIRRLLDIKLRSRSISPDKVEDLKRDTFIRVISAVRKGFVRQPERFGAFVNSICNNVLREYYRTVGKNQEMVETRQEIPEMVPDMAFDLEGMMASGEILVKESLITQDQLQKALEFQRANGGKLGSCLTRMGFVTDDDITGVLSRQYGVPSIDLKNYEIDPNVIKLIPQATALRYHLIPLSRVGSVLTIAMTDPTNVFAMDDIKFMTGFNVEPVVASEAAIGDAITRFYGARPPLRTRTRQEIQRWEQTEGLPIHAEMVPDMVLDLEGMVASKWSSERMRKILSEFPTRDRDLLTAVFLEEKDKDAVCREFGVDRDYLRVLLHRAKEKFKSLPALSKPEERQGLDEESTQGRGQGPSHSSRDKI